MRLPRVQDAVLPPRRRVVAVSDIHGNLPFLKGLLAKIGFSRDDILVLVGDMVEKGAQSLDTLRFIMELCRTHAIRLEDGDGDDPALYPEEESHGGT